MANLNRKAFNEERTWKAFIAVWATLVLLSLAFWAGVIYIGVHFAVKYW